MSTRIQSIAATVFALAFVALLAIMQVSVLGFGNNVNTRLSQSYSSTEAYELRAFDDTTVTGSTVISAFNNRENLYTVPLTIELNGTELTSISTVPTAANYISSTSAYTAKLLVNTNGITYGINFSPVTP